MSDVRLPSVPDVGDAWRGRGRLSTRYRDFGQDRRLKLTALPVCIGEVAWRVVLARHGLEARLRDAGAATVISRLALEVGPGPVTIASVLEAEVTVQLADGGANGLHLNMWATLRGARDGRASVVAGRLFAEHVVTRLSAPRGERRVAALPPLEPTGSWDRRPASELLELPVGAELADPSGAWLSDPAPVVFGVDHTDGNRHVNTLVFPQLAIEAGLRRLHAEGVHRPLRAEAMEICFRKPCFAGEVSRVGLRSWRSGEMLGVSAFLAPEGVSAERAHYIARVHYR